MGGRAAARRAAAAASCGGEAVRLRPPARNSAASRAPGCPGQDGFAWRAWAEPGRAAGSAHGAYRGQRSPAWRGQEAGNRPAECPSPRLCPAMPGAEVARVPPPPPHSESTSAALRQQQQARLPLGFMPCLPLFAALRPILLRRLLPRRPAQPCERATRDGATAAKLQSDSRSRSTQNSSASSAVWMRHACALHLCAPPHSTAVALRLHGGQPPAAAITAPLPPTDVPPVRAADRGRMQAGLVWCGAGEQQATHRAGGRGGGCA